MQSWTKNGSQTYWIVNAQLGARPFVTWIRLQADLLVERNVSKLSMIKREGELRRTKRPVISWIPERMMKRF
jgi:hypothetical protein